MKKDSRFNKEQYKKSVGFLMSFILTLVYTALFAFVWLTFFNSTETEQWIFFYQRGNWLLIVIYMVLVFLISKLMGAFKFSHMKMAEAVFSQVLTMIGVNLIMYFQIGLIGRALPEAIPFVALTIVDIAVSILWTLICKAIFQKLYPPHNLIMVYGSSLVDSISQKIKSREDRYTIGKYASIQMGMDKILELVPDYEGVIICDVPSKERNRILKFCFENSIRCYMIPKISDILIRSAEDIHMFDSPLLLSRNMGLSVGQRLIKRLLDIIISAALLIVVSPIMLIVAIAIEIDDRGPVFYKQTRLTRGNREFKIIKFRSMYVDAEKSGRAMLAKEGDPRITKVGKVIRAMRLDELPQLLNVIKGDMSFVGPRPERPELSAQYVKEMPEWNYRTKVKAGLTGYAQVMGKYNTTLYDKLKLDLTYISNYSLILDLKVVLMTIRIIFVPESTEGFEDNSAPEALTNKKKEDTEPKENDE